MKADMWRIENVTLTDGSLVYNVIGPFNITFEAVDERCAILLCIDLERMRRLYVDVTC